MTFHMSRGVETALRDHLVGLNACQRASGLLFPTKNGKVIASLDAYLARFWKRLGIEGGHAHRFRDTFAASMILAGVSLYDVAKKLGIMLAVAEKHYAPYAQELQERGFQIARAGA